MLSAYYPPLSKSVDPVVGYARYVEALGALVSSLDAGYAARSIRARRRARGRAVAQSLRLWRQVDDGAVHQWPTGGYSDSTADALQSLHYAVRDREGWPSVAFWLTEVASLGAVALAPHWDRLAEAYDQGEED